MKNSSRLLAKMARNLTRSSSGTAGSSASSSTRWLKRSQLSSRSRLRSAGRSWRAAVNWLGRPQLVVQEGQRAVPAERGGGLVVDLGPVVVEERVLGARVVV